MNTFDYIVVGAGSSGCVIASRLSEDPKRSVLLIEAGPSADYFWINTPAGMGPLFLNKRYNWGFTTQAVATLGGRKIYWPRGRTLGGTSSVNGMIYMRGHPMDFDHWAELGNEGWGWNDVLPYFRKSEDNERGGDELTGEGGLLRVSDPVVRHPSIDDFLEAAVANGIPRIRSLNAAPFEGVSHQQFTIRDGRRESTYTAFIKPALHRKNLTVRTGMQVLRVVLRDEKAVGVEVIENNQKRVIGAAREVILSAGALASPHLLMHSGIGDHSHLRTFGIDVQKHLPGVGQNLQDHWFAPFLMRVTPTSSCNANLTGLRKYVEGARYLLTRRGYLAMGSSAVSAYFRTTPQELQPDFQIAIRPMTSNFLPDGRVAIDTAPGMSGSAVLVGPKSVGYMALASPNPIASPAFHPNYLSDPDDVRRLLIGIRKFREIMRTPPIAARIVKELSPGPDITTDEDLLDFMKAYGSSGWHQAGTCKMGSDQMAVVDDRLRVHGVRRLRVADASIMPRITRGNTNAPAIMIGEKAADMIKEDAQAR